MLPKTVTPAKEDSGTGERMERLLNEGGTTRELLGASFVDEYLGERTIINGVEGVLLEDEGQLYHAVQFGGCIPAFGSRERSHAPTAVRLAKIRVSDIYPAEDIEGLATENPLLYSFGCRIDTEKGMLLQELLTQVGVTEVYRALSTRLN